MVFKPQKVEETCFSVTEPYCNKSESFTQNQKYKGGIKKGLTAGQGTTPAGARGRVAVGGPSRGDTGLGAWKALPQSSMSPSGGRCVPTLSSPQGHTGPSYISQTACASWLEVESRVV